MARDRWCDLSLSSERDQAACRSWVSLLVLPEDHLLLAQVYEADDGSTPRMRVLVRRANSNLSEVRRNQNKRAWTLKSASPSKGIIKRAEMRGLLTTTPSVGSVGR